MRKGNVTRLASIFIIASMMFSLGLGTMAYFNDTRVATGNTFTAGNLDVKLSATGAGGSWVDGPLTGFWSTPTNWAPGETYTRTIHFKNFGNVPVQVVLLDFKSYTSTIGSFQDVIEIVHFEDKPYAGFNAANAIAGFKAGSPPTAGTPPLTLRELMIMVPNGEQGYLDNSDLILEDWVSMNPVDQIACPTCTASGYPNCAMLGGTYLAPGEQGWLKLGFKFSSSASSAYESAQCSFDLQMSFIQGPHSGVCRHDLPGFVP